MSEQKSSVKNEQQVSQVNDLLQARRNSVSDFGDIEHRLEFVKSVDGIEYINDSKSTDENSTWYSLQYMKNPIVWIVGTPETEVDYDIFSDKVETKVKSIVCFGNGVDIIEKEFSNLVDEVIGAENISDAVKLATKLATEGDVILFSPACSSFELFNNYKERGNRFKECVDQI